LNTAGKYHNRIAGEVGFRLLGENSGGVWKIPGVRETVRAGPSFGFSLVTDKTINAGEDFLELSTERLDSGGSGGVEDEDVT
jgi:hypothetical protein